MRVLRCHYSIIQIHSKHQPCTRVTHGRNVHILQSWPWAGQNGSITPSVNFYDKASQYIYMYEVWWEDVLQYRKPNRKLANFNSLCKLCFFFFLFASSRLCTSTSSLYKPNLIIFRFNPNNLKIMKSSNFEFLLNGMALEQHLIVNAVRWEI